MNIKNKKKGFTLLEVLVVIGIIAVLSAVVLVAINPSRQFKLARDSQRTANVSALVNAIGQNMSENRGVFKCSGGAISFPSTSTIVKNSGGFDLAPCIVPLYISSMPFDPSASTAHYNSNTDYDTQYSLFTDANNRINITAVGEISTSTLISAVR